LECRTYLSFFSKVKNKIVCFKTNVKTKNIKYFPQKKKYKLANLGREKKKKIRKHTAAWKMNLQKKGYL
jgi:hypothetical protein